MNEFTCIVAGIVVPWRWLAVVAPVSIIIAVESTAVVIGIVWHPAIIVTTPAIVSPVDNYF